MANSPVLLRSTRLIEWTFGAFHTAFFVLVVFSLSYISGIADDLLSALDTLAGIGVFALLWATTWWCTRRAVAGLKKEGRFPIPPLGDLFGAGTIWGAVNGISFHLSALLIVFPILVLVDPNYRIYSDSTNPSTVFLSAAACVGIIIAPLIGGLVGMMLSLLDALIMWFALLVFDLVSVPSPMARREAKKELAG